MQRLLKFAFISLLLSLSGVVGAETNVHVEGNNHIVKTNIYLNKEQNHPSIDIEICTSPDYENFCLTNNSNLHAFMEENSGKIVSINLYIHTWFFGDFYSMCPTRIDNFVDGVEYNNRNVEIFVPGNSVSEPGPCYNGYHIYIDGNDVMLAHSANSYRRFLASGTFLIANVGTAASPVFQLTPR